MKRFSVKAWVPTVSVSGQGKGNKTKGVEMSALALNKYICKKCPDCGGLTAFCANEMVDDALYVCSWCDHEFNDERRNLNEFV